MNATEVVGYHYDGAAYCPECFGNGQNFPNRGYGPNPVFASDEGWEVDSCDGCGMTLAECAGVEVECEVEEVEE
jgi:hypothetical protein